MDFNSTEDSVIGWLEDAGNCTAEWANQNGPVPTGNGSAAPFITVSLTSMTPMGASDSIRTSNSGSSIAGREVQVKLTSRLDLVMSIQAFSNDMIGDNSAPAILERVRMALRMPSVRDELAGAGLFPYGQPTITNLATLIKVAFISRAQFDAHFYAVDELSEFIGNIKRVKGTLTLDGGTANPIDTGAV